MKLKTYFLALFLMICESIYAQTNNFSVTENGKLIWQNVYESHSSYDDILSFIINNGSFTDIVESNGMISCKIAKTTVDYKPMGYRRGAVPIYVSTNDFTGFVTVQVKDGRYRVTVDHIVMVCNTEGLSHIGDETILETWAVKHNKLTNGFSGVPSDIYNKFLLNTFNIYSKSYINDEW